VVNFELSLRGPGLAGGAILREGQKDRLQGRMPRGRVQEIDSRTLCGNNSEGHDCGDVWEPPRRRSGSERHKGKLTSESVGRGAENRNEKLLMDKKISGLGLQKYAIQKNGGQK